MFPYNEKLKRVRSLTTREMEVVFWQNGGKTDTEISTLLQVSGRTVQDRRTGIYQKLGMKDVNDNEKPKKLIEEYGRIIEEVVPNEAALKNYVPDKAEPEPEPPIIDRLPKETKPEPAVVTKKARPAWLTPLIGGGCLTALLCVGVIYGLTQANVLAFQNPLVTPSVTPLFQVPVIVVTATFLPTALSSETPIPLPTEEIAVAPTNTSAPTNTPLPTATEFVPPDSGILFEDNFDSGDLSKWNQNSGQWLVLDGKLTKLVDNVTNDYQWISLDRPEWKNYILSIDVNQPNGANDFVIAVRNNTSKSELIGFWVDRYQEINMALISEPEDNFLIVAETDIEIPPDSRVKIELEVQGDTYVLRSNSREIQRITLSGYESGGISIGTYCFYDGVGCTTFDNVKVTYLP